MLIGHWKRANHQKSRNRLVQDRTGGAILQGMLVRCSCFVHIDAMSQDDPPLATPQLAAGPRLARGVCRHLRGLDFIGIEEFVPIAGLRLDVLALGPKGEIWGIECKSGLADFRADQKWQGYLPWCDRFFWAVAADFPTEILPYDTGIILADAYGGEVVRMAPETGLAAARRRALVQRFARVAAQRLLALRDPAFSAFSQ